MKAQTGFLRKRLTGHHAGIHNGVEKLNGETTVSQHYHKGKANVMAAQAN